MSSLAAFVLLITPCVLGYDEAIQWDDSILIDERCAVVWTDLRDYRRFIEIIWPFVNPTYAEGGAGQIDSTVQFTIDGITINEHIVFLNEKEMYLSFVLTQGFELFVTYRGEWYLKPIGNDKKQCELHKGSLAIRNISSAWTNEQYKETVKEELETVKLYFEQNLRTKQDL